MPFCPQCQTEYRAGITTCADDGSELVAAPTDAVAFHGELVEVYAVFSEVEAERLRSVIEDQGVPCFVRMLRRAAFPTEAGGEAQIRIAVPQDEIARAKELIEAARQDEIISDAGAFF